MVKRRVHGENAGGAYAYAREPSPLRLRVESGTIAKQPAGPSLSGLIDALMRALAAGRHEAALDLVLDLLGLEPDEPRWYQRHGDILLALERRPAAAAAYRTAAQRYAIQGLAERASELHRLADELESATE